MFHHIKRTFKAVDGRTGLAVGAAIAVPTTVLFTTNHYKKKWMQGGLMDQSINEYCNTYEAITDKVLAPFVKK